MISLDDVDREILALLQIDCRRSAEEIGAEVGLSASAAHRRTQRLRDSRVIVSEVAVIDPIAVGRPMVMVVQLSIDREGPGHLAVLRAWIVAEPAIQQCWYVTGEADFILVVTVRDMDDFDQLIQRLLAENRNVRMFRTSVALSTTKRGLTMPTASVEAEERESP